MTRHARARIALCLALAPALLTAACEMLDKQDGAEPEVDVWATYLTCSSAATFQNQVDDVLVDRCLTCHQTESSFLLDRDNAGFNYAASLGQLLENDYFNPTINPLLVKATGGDSHVGGSVLNEIDDDYTLIAEWIIEERATPCAVGGGSGGD